MTNVEPLKPETKTTETKEVVLQQTETFKVWKPEILVNENTIMIDGETYCPVQAVGAIIEKLLELSGHDD